MAEKQSLEGMRFGRLTVLTKSPEMRGRSFTWVCKCDCGMITHPIATNQLLGGRTRSCGCLRNELTRLRSVTHNSSRTRLYGVWRSMKNRCSNPKVERYKHYGGRGITVCYEWRNSFEAFRDWAMAHGYSDCTSIDRLDANGNYCPENCRWVDATTQANNKSNNLLVEINGERKTLGEWAHITGIGYSTIYQRYRQGDRGETLIREVKA